jgi:hypothetical protein
MAKTTRKTAASSIEPKVRATRRKPAPATRTAETPKATPAPSAAKATKAPRKRAAAPARAATRKTSTVAVPLASAADRRAVMPARTAIDPTHDQIAERAYHIYLRRHGWPGNPDHDWLQAIAELRAERSLS